MNYELSNVTQKLRKFTEILIYAVGNPRIYRSTNVSVISVNFCVTMNYELSLLHGRKQPGANLRSGPTETLTTNFAHVTNSPKRSACILLHSSMSMMPSLSIRMMSLIRGMGSSIEVGK